MTELLIEALKQSEQINGLMDQSAKELSLVNKTIKQTLVNQGLIPVEIALEKIESVENKLRDALAKMTVVNQTWETEVRNRIMVDHQLAAALEQEGGARNAAFHDILTGLPNRALFNDRLEHAVAEAKRHGWTLAVMFVDLDKLKRINDTHGHHAGDLVLQTIAKRLKQNTRADDTVSRHGGDEFLYLATQIHEQKHLAMIAGKMLNIIRAPCEAGTASVSIEASIGIAIFPKDGATPELLIHKADEAMYLAKKNESGYEFCTAEAAPAMCDSEQTSESRGISVA